ncbi:MAG: hypothetical protein ABFE01_13995 [Phycisphaerales bacterium]
MYELLVRIETLFLGLSTLELLSIGIPMVAVGLVLWLGGSRYSTVIIGLLGAVVGAFLGLLVSQWLNLHPWLSMIGGAIVLAVASILLRNVLIVVLAVLVFSAVSGAGYIAVVLDRIAPAQAQTQPQAQAQIQPQRQAGLRIPIQSFSAMSSADRLVYMNDINKEAQTFAGRFKALLSNTWQAVGSQGGMVIIAVAVGAVVGILLVWFIAKIVIALAYSVVGTATIFLGAQAALLGAGVDIVSKIGPQPWVLPGAFIVMTAIGWVSQLFLFSGHKAKPEAHHHHHHHEEHEEHEEQ